MNHSTETDFDAVQFLQQLVAIKSHSGKEAQVAEFLVDQMQTLGMHAGVDEAGNAVGTRQNPADDGGINRHIVLLGHMDTVTGDIETRIEDGILHGRGSVDAKGPLATFITATAAAELQPGTRVTIVGAVEEEISTSKGARFAATQYKPDFCIIGEPSGWDGVTIGYKGITQINFLLERPMGHASGMHSGVPETAIEFWNKINNYVDTYNQGREKLFDRLIPAIRDFNFYSDGLHDRVKFHASVRLPLEFDHDSFKEWVEELDSEAYIRVFGHEEAYRSDRRHAIARAFNKSIRKRGQSPKFKVKTGTCDMNVVGPVWGCPIVAYGPGDSSLDHTPEEHLVIDEYLQAIDILQEVLQTLE